MDNQINFGNQNPQQLEQNPTSKTSFISYPEKPKFNFWIVAVILLVIFALSSFFIINNIRWQNKSSSNFSLTTQPSPTKPIRQLKFPPIVVLDPSREQIIDDKAGPAKCQPEFFDPMISKFSKDSSGFYIIPSETGVSMMIDGINKEGESKIILPSPFKMTKYRFGCASYSDYVLDLYKGDKRQALYAHILHFSFSKDGKKLYLVNNVNNQGNWTLHKRIIDIETEKEIELPNASCVTKFDGFWQGNRLLTYARADYGEELTDICVWDEKGKLISRIITTSYWAPLGNRDVLVEKIGFLPNQPDIFFAYTSKDENTCSLFLANIFNMTTKSLDILDKRNYQNHLFCVHPEVEFDLSNLYFDHGVLKYRVEKSKEASGKTTWSDWQTISVNK